MGRESKDRCSSVLHFQKANLNISFNKCYLHKRANLVSRIYSIKTCLFTSTKLKLNVEEEKHNRSYEYCRAFIAITSALCRTAGGCPWLRRGKLRAFLRGKKRNCQLDEFHLHNNHHRCCKPLPLPLPPPSSPSSPTPSHNTTERCTESAPPQLAHTSTAPATLLYFSLPTHRLLLAFDRRRFVRCAETPLKTHPPGAGRGREREREGGMEGGRALQRE